LAGNRAAQPTTRKVVVVICLVTIVALFGGVARQSLATNSAADEVVRLEASGAEMMHPLTTLLTELVTAQSAAVRGERVNQESVRTSVSALFEPDAQFGSLLQTNQRLKDLRDQVEAAFGAAETGAEAYAIWSTIVDLAVDLMQVIGDTSHLVHDPDLDSYHLMDAAIVSLPNAMVYAGRASDLAALAGGSELEGEDLVRAAVARFNVSAVAEQVSIGLNASVGFTERSELGASIAPRLDEFRAAADAFAPPTMLRDLATEIDAAEMASSANLVFTKAASLSHLLLSELQALLDARADTIERQRRSTIVASGAAALVSVVILWLLLVGRRTVLGRHTQEEPVTGGRGFSSGGFQPAGHDARSRTAAGNGSGDLAGTGPRRSGNAQ
jgi:hypothetical protein